MVLGLVLERRPGGRQFLRGLRLDDLDELRGTTPKSPGLIIAAELWAPALTGWRIVLRVLVSGTSVGPRGKFFAATTMVPVLDDDAEVPAVGGACRDTTISMNDATASRTSPTRPDGSIASRVSSTAV